MMEVLKAQRLQLKMLVWEVEESSPGTGLVTGNSWGKIRGASWPGAAEDEPSLCRAQGMARLVTVTALYLVVRKWLHKTHTRTRTARVRTQVSAGSRGRDPLELNQDEQKMVAADTLADSAGTKAHKPAT